MTLVWHWCSCVCDLRSKQLSRHSVAALLVILFLILLSGCAGQKTVAPEPLPVVAETYVTPAMLEEIEHRYGPVVLNRVIHWQKIMSSASEHSIEENLQRVNEFFNEASFEDDRDVWGHEDYWATPLEFIIMDAGDCEDFAMAKYFTLLQMGIDGASMRLTYCRSLTLNQPHMVVALYGQTSSSPLLLDNLNRRILPAQERQDLVPVYSFNGEDLWLARKDREEVRAGSAETLKRWQQWLAKTESRQVPVGLVIRAGL